LPWVTPNTDLVAQEIVEGSEAAVEPFREIASDVGADASAEKDR
jgi:hypothetical protein